MSRSGSSLAEAAPRARMAWWSNFWCPSGAYRDSLAAWKMEPIILMFRSDARGTASSLWTTLVMNPTHCNAVFRSKQGGVAKV